jgi:1,4-alpha-glucan branching enzyme
LNDHRGHFHCRNNKFYALYDQIVRDEKSLKDFARGYEKYGFVVEHAGIRYREWAPGAREMYLTGDFNGWDRRSHR